MNIASAEDLAASIAHEVNQPLAAIVVNAECCLQWLGKERPDLDMARQAAERIIRNGRHASAVIRSVRDMLGKHGGEMTRVDLAAVIDDSLELLAVDCGSEAITLETQVCADARFVRGDRTQVQQVLVNLMRNAIEAMSGSRRFPRHLQVRAMRNAAGEVCVAVSDSGPGIAAESARRIFEPFFTTKSAGMGLGLALSRSIVAAHGGQLSVRPRRPRGCTFEFTLGAWP